MTETLFVAAMDALMKKNDERGSFNNWMQKYGLPIYLHALEHIDEEDSVQFVTTVQREWMMHVREEEGKPETIIPKELSLIIECACGNGVEFVRLAFAFSSIQNLCTGQSRYKNPFQAAMSVNDQLAIILIIDRSSVYSIIHTFQDSIGNPFIITEDTLLFVIKLLKTKESFVSADNIAIMVRFVISVDSPEAFKLLTNLSRCTIYETRFCAEKGATRILTELEHVWDECDESILQKPMQNHAHEWLAAFANVYDKETYRKKIVTWLVFHRITAGTCCECTRALLPFYEVIRMCRVNGMTPYDRAFSIGRKDLTDILPNPLLFLEITVESAVKRAKKMYEVNDHQP